LRGIPPAFKLPHGQGTPEQIGSVFNADYGTEPLLISTDDQQAAVVHEPANNEVRAKDYGCTQGSKFPLVAC
jgi:hypothetical protein